MKEIVQRRIVPVSIITITCFAALVVFQLFVIFGGLEIKASSIKRIAPWAYEPYLRLVGEHPDSRQVQRAKESQPPAEKSASSMAEVAGFLDTEPVLPASPNTAEEPESIIPVTTPTEDATEPVDEDEPVG